MSSRTVKNTEDLFKDVIKGLRPLFKEHGFRSSGQNFTLESPECWVIVNFQKSRWSDQDETAFYVNVAATSKHCLEFSEQSTGQAPPYYSCAWQWRAEHFGPDKNIGKWSLRNKDDVRDVLEYLQSLFRQFVLPTAEAMTTNAGLLNLQGHPHLDALSVLQAATNQLDGLRHTVATLMERSDSMVINEARRAHLELLRSKYPGAMRSIELETQ